jgi:hypothetical protein
LELAQRLDDEDLYRTFLNDATLEEAGRSEVSPYLRPERMEQRFGPQIQKVIDLVFSREGKPLPVGSHDDVQPLFLQWTVEATEGERPGSDWTQMGPEILNREQAELYRTLQDVYRLTHAQLWDRTSSHLEAFDQEMEKYSSDSKRLWKGVRQFGKYSLVGLGAAALFTPVGAAAAGIGVGLVGMRGMGFLMSRRKDRKDFENQRKQLIQDYKGQKERRGYFRSLVEESVARERQAEVEALRHGDRTGDSSLPETRDAYIRSFTGAGTINPEEAATSYEGALEAKSDEMRDRVREYLNIHRDEVLEDWNRARPEDQQVERFDSRLPDGRTLRDELMESMTRLFQVQESGLVMCQVLAQQHQREPTRLDRAGRIAERFRGSFSAGQPETFRIPFTEREVHWPVLFFSQRVPNIEEKNRRMRTVAALAVGSAFVATAGTWGLAAGVAGGAVAGVRLGQRIAGHYEEKKGEQVRTRSPREARLARLRRDQTDSRPVAGVVKRAGYAFRNRMAERFDNDAEIDPKTIQRDLVSLSREIESLRFPDEMAWDAPNSFESIESRFYPLIAQAEQTWSRYAGSSPDQIPLDVREMRQAAQQCRDLYLAYLYQEQSGMRLQHVRDAIGQDRDSQYYSGRVSRRLRQRRMRLSLLTAIGMAVSTGPGSHSLLNKKPAEPQETPPAVEAIAPVESEARFAIASGRDVVTQADLQHYIDEHGVTRARQEVKFDPETPQFVFQKFEEKTGQDLLHRYSEEGFLESLGLKPGDVIPQQGTWEEDGAQWQAIFYLRPEDGRFVGRQLKGATAEGVWYDEVYYDAFDNIAFAKRTDPAPDPKEESVTIEHHQFADRWSHHLQLEIYPNRETGEPEFMSSERLEFGGEDGMDQQYVKSVEGFRDAEATVEKIHWVGDDWSVEEHLDIDPKDR